jgi:hypothetical protein
MCRVWGVKGEEYKEEGSIGESSVFREGSRKYTASNQGESTGGRE